MKESRKNGERVDEVQNTGISELSFSNLQDVVGLHFYAEVHHHCLLPLPASSLILVRSDAVEPELCSASFC
jgi:hypothetical protein